MTYTSLKTVAGWLTRRPRLTVSTLLVGWSLAIVLLYNGPFWRASIGFLAPEETGQWLAISLFGLALAALQVLVFMPVSSLRTVKPLLLVLTVSSAAANYFSTQLGTYFDVAMLTNLLETDLHESSQLITGKLAGWLLLTGLLPALALWRIEVVTAPRERRQRVFTSVAAVAVLALGLLDSLQSFSPLMRNHKELRYLITPGNLLVALPRALAGQAEKLTTSRTPIGLDAKLPAPSKDELPRLVVLVVGETQRAANWQLNGYPRPTTPELAARNDLFSFTDVSSCGTSTAVSLPCMFSRQRRSDYSASSARGEHNLVDVIAHAGVGVEWIDNQSGCKGACRDVETDRIASDRYPKLCARGECYDEVLVRDLVEELGEPSHRGNQLLVMHMMGSHGPAYYRRYPQQSAPFTPDCRTDELSHCSQQEIINAYDNSIAYSDRVLNQLIETLSADRHHQTALIYVSDHGESLGEMGLYLHGLPYFMAPQEQTKVPMFYWFSEGFKKYSRLDSDCFRRAQHQPASHDNLFHTLLGAFQINTELYQPAYDLIGSCRSPD